MQQFLHMHHVMANRAMMMESTRKEADPWNRDKAVLRQILLSGQADYRSGKFEKVTVTDADREMVLRYLNA